MPSITGLFASMQYGQKQALPLTGIAYDVDIIGFASSITINQTYKNTENVDLECVYGFPMNDQAAVTGFTVKVGNRVLVSRLKAKDEAFQEYHDTLAKNGSAVLLDQSDDSDDTFVMSVGRLKQGEECVVSIAYVATLDALDEVTSRLVIPLALSPRYSPAGWDAPGKVTAPQVYKAGVPYLATLKARVEGLAYLDSVTSPSHQLKITSISPQISEVCFAGQQQPLDCDLIIDIHVKQNPTHHVVVEKTEKGNYVAMYSYVPHFDQTSPVKSELIFLLDCSGSMQGQRIQDARQALIKFLRCVPIGCYFNIYRFGSTYTSLFRESTLYTVDTLAQARTYVQALNADLGGTEILSALENIYRQKPKDGFSRQLFVLTDGEVGNTEQVVDLVQKHSNSTRVFAFGIGDRPSRSLVNGIAAAGNGKAEFVKSGETVEFKIGRHLERAMQPAIVNAKVSWMGMKNVQQVPSNMPPVFLGNRSLAFAFFDKDSNNPSVTLEIGGKSTTTNFTLVSSNGQRHLFLAQLAARALIKQTEADFSQMPSKTGSSKQIADISMQYGIMSKYVSLIAVEKPASGNETAAPMELREIPIELCESHGDPLPDAPYVAGAGGRKHRSGLAPAEALSLSAGEAATADSKKSQHLEILLELQDWDGSWSFTKELEKATGISRSQAQKICGDKWDEKVLATILVMLWIKEKFSSESEVWKPVVQKAAIFLNTNLDDQSQGSIRKPLEDLVKHTSEPISGA